MRGLSLIELMISMLIGLMVVGSAIGVFLSNQRTYRTTEALARVQENARVGFELMAREVREAGGNPCARNLPVANILENSDDVWWSTWANGVFGHDNGSYVDSVGTTDAIDLMSAASNGVTITETPSTTSANFKVNTNDHGFEVGDILMVCDYSQASIFQATNVNLSNVTVVHNAGGSVAPGNCTKGLGLPVTCTANGSPKIYDKNSKIVEFKASRWFIAENGRGSRSLYRISMRTGAEQPKEEVAEGIQDMQVEYLTRDAVSYVDAPAVGVKWEDVVAVRITLTLLSNNNVGTGNQALERKIQHVVTLRNRIS
ncbi:PilW family protein [Lysobacter sp. A286]